MEENRILDSMSFFLDLGFDISKNRFQTGSWVQKVIGFNFKHQYPGEKQDVGQTQI